MRILIPQALCNSNGRQVLLKSFNVAALLKAEFELGTLVKLETHFFLSNEETHYISPKCSWVG